MVYEQIEIYKKYQKQSIYNGMQIYSDLYIFIIIIVWYVFTHLIDNIKQLR